MEKKSLSQQTADRLYTMIVVERRLSPGEKLPSELDLSRELGVSRTTLREAIHVLASQKILEVRRGDERRQMILGKSCIVSFAGTLVFLLLSMLLFALTSGTVWLHPIVCLIVALLFFTMSLAYYNRKLGG